MFIQSAGKWGKRIEAGEMRIIGSEFVESIAEAVAERIPGEPGFCIVGRSNVGKSSLINTLTAHKIARTSSTPGATRLINLYKIVYDHEGVKKTMFFYDFPGFGYAKVSKNTYRGWEGMVDRFLDLNSSIRRIVWIYDIRRDFDEMDAMVYDWIHEKGLPFTFVVTKIDKEGKNHAAMRRKYFQKLLPGIDIFLFSSKNGFGKDQLLNHILQEAEQG